MVDGSWDRTAGVGDGESCGIGRARVKRAAACGACPNCLAVMPQAITELASKKTAFSKRSFGGRNSNEQLNAFQLQSLLSIYLQKIRKLLYCLTPNKNEIKFAIRLAFNK